LDIFNIMVYNIEHMREMFKSGEIKPEASARAAGLAQQIAEVAPHLLGIVEASDKASHHEAFLAQEPLRDLGYSVTHGKHKRGRQDLVLYHRPPFVPLEVDGGYEFFEDWLEDIDDDGIMELCTFERRPLEVLFGIEGTDVKLLVMVVATKSKGVFTVQDIIGYQHRALANRKRLLAQCRRIRKRVDQLMESHGDLPIILMGDFNDSPGMDSFERLAGGSAIEAAMGSIFEPRKVLHNTLWHLVKSGQEVWTTQFPDMIVANFREHRAWLDHILVSPSMLASDAKLSYVLESGAVGQATAPSMDGLPLSDHRPIFCKIRLRDSSNS